MTIAIIGTVGVPANYGGFETLVENLLDSARGDVAVYCSSRAYDSKEKNYKGSRLHYIPLKANGAQSILYDMVSMIHAVAFGYRTLLVLGVSGSPIIPVLKLLIPGLHIVTNIDGLEWRRDKWSKFVKGYLKFAEKLAVKCSDSVVADNEAISEYICSEYGRENTVIAYGGDHAWRAVTDCKEVKQFAFSVCRIEPENNIEMILEAFSCAEMRLVFIGNWSSSNYGRSLREKYRKYANIEICDPIYDVEKLARLRSSCSLYVHGHSAGGTNPSLVEIMHFAKPVFAFDCSYNRATTENAAFYFCSSDELCSLLYRDVGSLWSTGDKMKEIAQRRYTWSIVSAQYWELLKNVKDDMKEAS